MIYLDIILKVLGILSLLTFMIIIIWGFVVFNSIYSQLRYSNYILEKISHILNISCIDMQSKKKQEYQENINNDDEIICNSLNDDNINKVIIDEPKDDSDIS